MTEEKLVGTQVDASKLVYAQVFTGYTEFVGNYIHVAFVAFFVASPKSKCKVFGFDARDL